MLPKEIEDLHLKQGERIRLWLRFRTTPREGTFVLHTHETIFLRLGEIIKGTSINHVSRVERVS
jgi:hypothetical protein